MNRSLTVALQYLNRSSIVYESRQALVVDMSVHTMGHDQGRHGNLEMLQRIVLRAARRAGQSAHIWSRTLNSKFFMHHHDLAYRSETCHNFDLRESVVSLI